VALGVSFLPTSGERTHFSAQSDTGIGSVVVGPDGPEKGVEYAEHGGDDDSQAEQGEAGSFERARHTDYHERWRWATAT